MRTRGQEDLPQVHENTRIFFCSDGAQLLQLVPADISPDFKYVGLQCSESVLANPNEIDSGRSCPLNAAVTSHTSASRQPSKSAYIFSETS